MPEVELKRLRELRRRADTLFSTLVADLKPFHDEQKLEFGFWRTPRSDRGQGVNITTTCSCLMALALSGRMKAFYGDSWKTVASKLVDNVIKSTWMSSGLTENNAFTSTLVIRLIGFLTESKVLTRKEVDAFKKKWEDKIQFKPSAKFARRLSSGKDPFLREIFKMLPKSLRDKLSQGASRAIQSANAKWLASELTSLIATTPFLPLRPQAAKFSKKLSKEIEREIAAPQTQYKMARLNRLLLHHWYPSDLRPIEELSLSEIVSKMGADPAAFGINNYPASSTVLYWFVDGIDRAGYKLTVTDWSKICEWAQAQFLEQRSLVVARNMAMMDPVAMAMAACLCARLRVISVKARLGMGKSHYEKLPSMVELEHSIIELFQEQTENGIWPKYFPLFHYPDVGSNFCFTFEMLEAVLKEFGAEENTLVQNELFIAGLERAVLWCERDRLEVSKSQERSRAEAYSGWNSGGILVSLRCGEPESWATAVVHMFFWELREFLSVHIQKRLLHSYKATPSSELKKDLKQIMDIPLFIRPKHTGLKKVLKDSIIKTYTGKTGPELRRSPVEKEPLSALLFGPPGTSKTQIAKAIARQLKWPLVEIDPSHFLQSSFQNIYVQAEKIFEDVMDLSGVVILFDELDALVQRRDGQATPVDIESKFLTTYMLPKLAKLHDQGRVVFLMATNFLPQFDEAIKRAGRFDFLLCMGPPKLKEKCKGFHEFLGLKVPTHSTIAAGAKILEYCQDNLWLRQQLELYTFLEFKTFIARLDGGKDILRRLVDLTEDGFERHVRSDCETAGLKYDDLGVLLEMYNVKTVEEMDCEPIQIADLKNKSIDLQNPTIRYVLERQQSRRQC